MFVGKAIIGWFFYEWKIIPLYIRKTLGDYFKFHSNADYKLKTKFFLLEFYENILSNWTIYFTTSPGTPLVFWMNFYVMVNISKLIVNLIQIKNKTPYFKRFSENIINFVMDLFDEHRKDGKLLCL